jgi:hypothetical protein
VESFHGKVYIFYQKGICWMVNGASNEMGSRMIVRYAPVK